MLFICILGGLAAAQTSTLPELRTAAATMTPGNLLRHIRDLSSDAYDGRLPGYGDYRVGLGLVANYHATGCYEGGELDIHPDSGDWLN